MPVALHPFQLLIGHCFMQPCSSLRGNCSPPNTCCWKDEHFLSLTFTSSYILSRQHVDRSHPFLTSLKPKHIFLGLDCHWFSPFSWHEKSTLVLGFLHGQASSCRWKSYGFLIARGGTAPWFFFRKKTVPTNTGSSHRWFTGWDFPEEMLPFCYCWYSNSKPSP